MPLSQADVLRLQGEAFADDVPILDEMTVWSEDDVISYFESGGRDMPRRAERAVAAAESAPDVKSTAPLMSPGTQEPTSLSALELKAGVDRGAGISGCCEPAQRGEGDGRETITVDQIARLDVTEQTACQADGESAAPAATVRHETRSAKELRAALRAAHIDTTGCLDRADLVALAQQHARVLERSAAPSWAHLPVKELRALLVDAHISTAGCLDRDDLLRTAADHASALEEARLQARRRQAAAVLVPPSSRLADAETGHAQRARVERALAHLGGVVHGGYQVDLFGVKRGRCQPNPRCFRFKPANVGIAHGQGQGHGGFMVVWEAASWCIMVGLAHGQGQGHAARARSSRARPRAAAWLSASHRSSDVPRAPVARRVAPYRAPAGEAQPMWRPGYGGRQVRAVRARQPVARGPGAVGAGRAAASR